MAELQLWFFSLSKFFLHEDYLFPLINISFFCMEITALEAQIQALHQAANRAATTVNARGDLLVHHLQDIPNRARQIATHGVRQEAATALAMTQTCTRHNLLLLEPVFPEGEGRAGFNDLVVQFDVTANAIVNEVSADSVVTKVLVKIRLYLKHNE
jgi:hypothetical protein